MRNKRKLLYLTVYTFSFNVIFVLGYMAFIKKGKSFMWYDGYMQHYPALVYIGKYIREIAANLLAGDFTIPQFEYNLGMGQNIIAMLNLFDGLGDPFLLLSAFVPVKYSELLYNALVVLKLYLAGIGFSAFCFYMKKAQRFTLIGALMYVFCGYALYAGVRHPSFINPMIYFPFLLIGIDKIINKEKPWTFIITVCIAAFNGFYFLYVSTIFVFIYAIIKYINIYKGSSAREFLYTFAKGAMSYILGIVMSSAVFLPAVLGFLSSARSESRVDPGNLLFYDISYYFSIFLKSVSPSGSWKYVSLAAIYVFAFVVLLMRRDEKYRPLKAMLAVCLLFYLIPFGGYLTNGFSYVSGRWTYIISFLLSYVAVCILPLFRSLESKEIKAFCIITAAYGIIGLVHPKVRNINTIYGFAVLLLTLILVILIQPKNYKSILKLLKLSDKPAYRRLGAALFGLVVMVNIALNANLLYGESFNNYISEFEDYGEALTGHKTMEVAAALPLPHDGFYRVDSIQRLYQNAPLILDYPSVTGYFSILNYNVSEALYDLEDSQLSQAYNLYGLDNRAMLDTLASVRYISALDGSSEEYVPYGFAPALKRIRNGKSYTIYENQYVLPLGYTYSSYITYDEYAKMNALEKQEALLQSAVLETEAKDYPRGNPASTYKRIDYTISEMDGVDWDGTKLTVSKTDASITVSFEGLPNSETYLRLKNYDIDESGHENFYIRVGSGKVQKICRVMSDSYKFSLGRKNYLVNLGYSEIGKNTAVIVFPSTGVFRLDDIEIYCQPMDSYSSYVEKLAEEILEDIVVTANKVTGTIDLSADKILCISIGYSDGWTANVDGRKADILKVNGMFMGIPLDKGYHTIELTYRTPGLKAGAVLSITGMLAFMLLFIFYRGGVLCLISNKLYKTKSC